MKDKFELIMGNRELFDQFLDLTAKSIKTERGCPRRALPWWTPESWPAHRGTMTAEQRVKAWCKSEGVYIYNCSSTILYSGEAYLSKYKFSYSDALTSYAVPVFPNIVDKVLKSTSIRPGLLASNSINQTKETKEMYNTKNKTVEAVVDANKEAVKIAGKLAVGKAANLTLLRKVTSKFPWYAKLFGKAKELENNPLAKLASAEIVIALSKHFAPDNEKLRYLSEAMLQEAMVDVVTNSTQLESVINELTSLVPDNIFESKTK